MEESAEELTCLSGLMFLLPGSIMASRQQPKVYVVDDERVIAFTLATILTQSGFITAAFTNPLEALQAAQKDCPDLLISDVVMPGLSGIDLAIQMRSLCSTCRVLLFSGQAATADLLEVARKNGNDFELLSKPVHPTDLLAAIRELSS
jgi:CheY-like chemotaxis protein